MSRIKLIVGLLIATAIYFGWNMFHPGEAYVQNYQEFPANPQHLPVMVWLGWLVLVYMLCWINIVNEWERRPVMFFGRLVRILGPGLSFVEPITHSVLPDVNVQDVVIEVPVGEVQTKDNVSVAMVGVLTYRIAQDRVKDAVVQVDDVGDSTYQRALSTLTDVAATNELDRLLEHRDKFCEEILAKLITRVDKWGVTVQAFELKAFKINDEAIEQAIAMKARAAKEGAAELVRAELQEKIAQALNKAAETYNENGKWLKELETLLELCRSANNNTVLIPNSPMGALSKLSAPMTG